MKRLQVLAVVAVTWVGIEASALAVTVVNVDFQPNLNPEPNGGAALYNENYSGTAAAPDSGTTWNALAAANDTSSYNFVDTNVGVYDEVAGAVASYNNLVDSNNNSTGLNISFDAGGTFATSSNAGNYNNIATNAKGLMRDYLIAFEANSNTVNITGLTPNEPVVLYLYGEGDNLNPFDRQTTFTANGVTGSTFGTDGGNLATPSDYIVLRGATADGSGNLSIEYAINNTTGGYTEGPFNGLQLVYGMGSGQPGDTNGDNIVNAADYENIRSNFRNSGLLTRMQGDISGPGGENYGDGVVDFYDFIAWQKNFGNNYNLSGVSSAAVPEPCTWMLALAAIGAGAAISRRRRG